MVTFNVAEVTLENQALALVFVPSETTHLGDTARRHFLDMLIAAGKSSALKGYVMPVWEFEGETKCMGEIPMQLIVRKHKVADLMQLVTRQVTVTT